MTSCVQYGLEDTTHHPGPTTTKHAFQRYIILPPNLPYAGPKGGLFSFDLDRCDCLLASNRESVVEDGASCVWGVDNIQVRVYGFDVVFTKNKY